MSLTAFRSLAAVVASAAAVVGIGILATPEAHADSCTVDGDNLRLEQHNGNYTTTVTVNANGSAFGPGVVVVPPSGTNPTYGSASGSINGRNIDIAVTWNDNTGNAHVTGTIGDDGVAHGSSTGTPIPINLWNPGPWVSGAPLKCAGEQAANVTNAIQLSFGPPHLGNITATISNSSDLTAQCTYDAQGIVDAHRDFQVGPKGSTALKFSGFNTGTSYHVVVSCKDASGKQPGEIGHAETNVTF
jgi:hypothetical protein